MLASHDTKFRLTCVAVKRDRKEEGEMHDEKTEEISKKKKNKRKRFEKDEEASEEKSNDEPEENKQEGIIQNNYPILHFYSYRLLTREIM